MAGNSDVSPPTRIWIGARAKYLLDEEGSCLCYSRQELGGEAYIHEATLMAKIEKTLSWMLDDNQIKRLVLSAFREAKP